MNEKAAEALLNYIESTNELLLGQTPALCQEIVQFAMIKHIISLVFCLALLSFTIACTVFAYKKVNRSRLDTVDKGAHLIVLFVFSFFLSVIFISCSFNALTAYCKAKYAPRYYLIQALLGERGE